MPWRFSPCLPCPALRPASSLWPLHAHGYLVVYLNLFSDLLAGQNAFPHDFQIKIALPIIDPCLLESVGDSFPIERLAGVFANPFDRLKNLVGGQSDKTFDAAVAHISRLSCDAIFEGAYFDDGKVATETRFRLLGLVDFGQRPFGFREVPGLRL